MRLESVVDWSCIYTILMDVSLDLCSLLWFWTVIFDGFTYHRLPLVFSLIPFLALTSGILTSAPKCIELGTSPPVQGFAKKVYKN